MNPNQPPGLPTPGGTPLPNPPQSSGSISDIPENGFGFTDEAPGVVPAPPITPRPAQPIAAPQPAQAFAPRPAPILTPPARPLPQPVAPQAQPTVPQPAPVATAPIIPPVPSNLMPPQQIPPVPTATPAAPAPTTPQPQLTAPTQPQPTPTAYAAPAAQTIATAQSFDPANVPVHASSTSENPITASFTPQPSMSHLPNDIAQRINEKPMQNSGDILRQIKHGLNGSRLKSVLSFILFTISIFAAAFLINQFVFQSYYVEGTSMTPTLDNNDRLIISKVERTIAGIQGHSYIPERGQIVVLDSSIIGLNGQHEQLIKRVIGLPGDRIHIEAGSVTVTNTQHPEGYDVTRDLGLTNLQPTYTDEPIDVTVTDGQIYVMGDNREQGGSYDSRAFGPIDGNQIQGRLWGRVLPIEKAQLY
jgi:signal peptidase I